MLRSQRDKFVFPHKIEKEHLKMKPARTKTPISELDPRQALYELQLYQEELVEQNTELQSARKQNETLLAKYTMLYDQAPSGYLTLDQAGKILELNLNALTFFYKDRSKLINTDFKEFISNDTRPVFDEFFQIIFRNITKASCEVTFSINGDSPVYLHIEGIASDDGENCLLSMVDITAAKQIEKDLWQSRQEFQNYFESGSIGMSVSSPDKDWIELNQQFCKMLGYAKNELLRINWMDLSHPDDLRANLDLYQQALDGKLDRYQMNKRFIRKDSTILYVILSVIFQRNEDGTVHHILASYVDITERKLAEVALKQSEEKYRTLLELAPDAFFHGDSKGNFILVNDKAIEFTGFSEEELLAMNMSDLFSQNVLNEKPLRYDLLIHGDTIIAEREIVKKNGNRIQVEMNSKAMPDGTFQCLMKDITDRKMAEEALKESERLLLESQTIAGLGSFIWNISTGLWTSSKILDDIFGIEENYIRSFDGWTNIVHPDCRNIMIDYVTNEVLVRFVPFDKEYKVVKQNDGQERWVHGLAKLEFDENNQPIKLIGTIRDITDRKLTEEVLKEREEKYRSLVQYSSDPIFSFNPDESYRFVNEAFAQPFGKTPEQIIGKTLYSIFAHDEAEKRLTLIRRVFQTGHKEEIEVKVITHSGEVRYYLTTVDPNKDDQGKVCYITCVSKDITPLRR